MIKLGYEIPTGELVEIPLKHLAVTGQTQESGKTTTLEAVGPPGDRLPHEARRERPKLEDLAKLGRGQFWACWQDRAVRVYVQPAWLPDDQAIAVSRGELRLEELPATSQPEEPMSRELEKKVDQLTEAISQLVRAQPSGKPPAAVAPATRGTIGDYTEEELYERFKMRLIVSTLSKLIAESPVLLKVLTIKPELEVHAEQMVLSIDGTTLKGRLAQAIANGYFDQPKTGNAAFEELKRRGVRTAKPNVYRELDKLAEMGFLTKEATGYQLAPGAKVHVKK